MATTTFQPIEQFRHLPREARCSHQDGARGYRHGRRCISQGNDETSHEVAVLSLLETAQSSNLKFNPTKIQFKTKECKVFGQLLTPEGISINKKKVNAIRKMGPLQPKKELKSFQGMVNCLKWYSSRLTQVAEPLKNSWEITHIVLGIQTPGGFRSHQRRANQGPSFGLLWPEGGQCHPSEWIHERFGCSPTAER